MDNTQFGHRDRLRKRINDHGTDGFSDQEILEYLLFAINAPRDTKPIVKACFKQFHSLEGILYASPNKLLAIDGVGEETVRYLQIIVALLDRLSFQNMKKADVTSNWKDLEYYCVQKLSSQPIEKFLMICLDSQNKVITVKDFGEGTLNQMTVYPREVLKAASDANAASVIFIHNRPSHDTRASRQDIDLTKRLKQIFFNQRISPCMIM